MKLIPSGRAGIKVAQFSEAHWDNEMKKNLIARSLQMKSAAQLNVGQWSKLYGSAPVTKYVKRLSPTFTIEAGRKIDLAPACYCWQQLATLSGGLEWKHTKVLCMD